MNAVLKTQDYYRAAHAEAAARLPGDAAWLRELRQQALDRFQGFPDARDEDWKYTRTSAIERAAFECVAGAHAEIDRARLAPALLAGTPVHRVVFVNGVYAPDLSAMDQMPAGVTVISLAGAMVHAPDVLHAHLGRIASLEGQSFAQLNTAFVADGAYIHLARGAVVEAPIQLLFVSTAAQAGKVAHPRVLVVAEALSQATVVSHYLGLDDGSYLTNAVTEIALDDGAQLTHYTVQQEAPAAFHVSGTHVRLGRDSHYRSQVFSLGSQLARNEIRAQLAAPGAQCDLSGLYMADGRQHLDHHTHVDHAAPHGTSRQFYKGVMDGRGRGVFSGTVVVRPDAQKTDAQQSNKNLLLSADAEADARPQLEIYADDVKCSHGATVGQLDADSVFYLRARGLDETAARTLLTYAFAHEMVAQVALAPLRVQLEAAVRARLPEGHRIEELV